MEFCTGRKFKSRVKPSRNFDICYDSTLCFPSIKDYNRAMTKAVAAATHYDIQPYFQTMFSDTRPRLAWKSRCILPISSPSEYLPIISEEITLSGHAMHSRRPVFFKQPITKPKSSKTLELQPFPEEYHPKKQPTLVCNKSIQTDYRDSETQTDAWAHDVIATQGSTLLQLNWLHIDSFTEPGMTEITQIQRFWQKQAWDTVLPKMELVHKIRREAMTHALAANDTATKDDDIEVENRQRLAMVAEKIAMKFSGHRDSLCDRLERFHHLLRENKSETVSYLKHKLCRDLRKLGMKHRGVEFKYKSRFFRDVLAEITDRASNLNAPQIRFGDDLSDRKVLGEITCRHLTEIQGLELLEERMIHSGTDDGSGLKSFMRPRNSSCKRRMINMAKELELDCVEDLGECSKKSGLVLLKSRECPEIGARVDNVSDWADEDTRFHVILGKVIQGHSVKNELSNDFVQG